MVIWCIFLEGGQVCPVSPYVPYCRPRVIFGPYAALDRLLLCVDGVGMICGGSRGWG